MNTNTYEKPKNKRGVNLNSPYAIQKFLSRLSNQCAMGKLSPTRAQACGSLCRVILSALEQGEAMEKIKEMQKLLGIED